MNPDNPWRTAPGYGPYHPEAFWFAAAVFVVIAIAVLAQRMPPSVRRRLSLWSDAAMGLLIFGYFAAIVFQVGYGFWQWLTG